MRDLRVLVLTPDFPPALGGIQLLVHRVTAHAPGGEHRVVTLAAPGAEAFDRDQPMSVRRVAEVPVSRRLTVARLNGAGWLEARAFRPDVVLSGHIVTSPAARLIARRLGAPFVQYAYAEELVYRPRLARSALAGAAAVIVLSAYSRDLALGMGAAEHKLRVIPPGVDAPPPRQLARRERPTLVTVGRLEDRYKGHDVVARALPAIREQVPDVEWVVIGQGSLRAELERAVAANGSAGNVRFLGSVPDAERDEWLDTAHAFVMPARVPAGGGGGEGFGIVYLEAGVHGLPVVAGNAGGLVDAVADGETGCLVDAEDPAAVAGAVVRILTNRELAARLGSEGERRARQLTWTSIAARVGAVLEEAAGRGRA